MPYISYLEEEEEEDDDDMHKNSKIIWGYI